MGAVFQHVLAGHPIQKEVTPLNTKTQQCTDTIELLFAHSLLLVLGLVVVCNAVASGCSGWPTLVLHPVVACISLVVSPPLPMIIPTASDGTYIASVILSFPPRRCPHLHGKGRKTQVLGSPGERVGGRGVGGHCSRQSRKSSLWQSEQLRVS
jgi:hypothetical protein